VLQRGGGGPVVEAVDDEPVGPPVPVGARGGQELGEGRGEAVEGLEEEPKLVVGDAVGGLGAFGVPLDARERQRHELDARRRGGEAGDVARRGDQGHAVAPRRQPLGELQAREQVAEREPREDHDAQRPRAWGPGIHDRDGARRELASPGQGGGLLACLLVWYGMVNGVAGGTSNLRGCLVHRRMQPRHSCGAPHIFKQLFGRQLNLGQPHENAGISPYNASLQCSAQLL